MAILIEPDMTFLVQGITGREGSYFTAQMLTNNTPIVGGITPEKGGDWLHGIPVFDNVRTALDATGANASIVFVNTFAVLDALYEAINARLQLIVCVTDGIPIRDTLKLQAYLRHQTTVRLLGPSSPGILIPGRASVGIVPAFLGTPGKVGVVARSASLGYEVMSLLSAAGIGQSTFVGIGGDPVVGTTLADVITLFEEDMETTAIVLIGEIGGASEIEAAAYIASRSTKPVIAYIAGTSVAPHIRMGHAGAVVTTQETTAAVKIDTLRNAGARVASSLDELVWLLRDT